MKKGGKRDKKYLVVAIFRMKEKLQLEATTPTTPMSTTSATTSPTTATATSTTK